MFESFITVTQSILKLLKLQKDAKKIDLETRKLQREEKEVTSLLKIATDEQIKKYDPRIAAIEERIKAEQQQQHQQGYDGYRRNTVRSNSIIPRFLFAIIALLITVVLLVRIFIK